VQSRGDDVWLLRVSFNSTLESLPLQLCSQPLTGNSFTIDRHGNLPGRFLCSRPYPFLIFSIKRHRHLSVLLTSSSFLLSKFNSFSFSITFYSIALKNKHKLVTASQTSFVLIPLSAIGKRVVINTWQSWDIIKLKFMSFTDTSLLKLMRSLKVLSNHAKTNRILFSLPLTRWLQQREGSSPSLFSLHRARA
jgi:hypothetical protein